MKYLIAGLGNIGPEYELTRHNIGFLILDRLAEQNKVSFSNNKLAFTADFKFKGKSFHLIKPTTYMNLSGKAINYWMQELKIQPENLLVVTDDIALPFGSLRMRQKGSNAGHNGLKSVESVMGNNVYPRLKCGIGDNFHKGQQVDYVLSRFSHEEFKNLSDMLDKACEMIHAFGCIGIERTMSQFN